MSVSSTPATSPVSLHILQRSLQRVVLDGADAFGPRACEALAQAPGVVHAAILMFDDGQQGLALAAQSGQLDLARWLNGSRHLELVSTRPAFPGQQAAQAQAMAMAEPDDAGDAEFAQALRALGVAALVGIPLQGGALSLLLAAPPAQLARDDMQLIGQLADHGFAVARLHARNAELAEQLEQASATDALTTVANRRQAELVLVRELERSARYGTPLSLLMFELQGLAEIRRERGAACGDRLLKEAARATRAKLRDADLLARWDEERFVVVAPHADAAGAATLAAKLRTTISGTSVPGCGRAKARLGLVQCQPNETLPSLLQRVQAALTQEP